MRLEEMIEKKVSEIDFPGVVHFPKEDDHQYLKAFGFADRSNKLLNDHRFRFAIA
jgi:hypothetical protein